MSCNNNNAEHVRGVLLFGGLGTRVDKLTDGGNKHLLRIANRTLAEHAVDFLYHSGVSRITCVTNSQHLDRFAEVLSSSEQPGLVINYAYQDLPVGNADALIRAIQTWSSMSDLIAVCGDNIFEYAQPWLVEPLPRGVKCRILIDESTHSGDFTVVELGNSGEVVSIELKPSVPRSPLVIVCAIRFSADLIGRLATIEPNSRGEKDMVELVVMAWKEGSLEVKQIAGEWTDCASSIEAFDAACRSYENWQGKSTSE